MKINEKSLIKFANSNAPIDKSGYLLKRGEINKGFQKRWFLLKGNLLFYYEKPADKEPLGAIILESCRVDLSLSDQFTFQLVYPGAHSRTYMFGAETQEDMEDWMKAMSGAGYEYMRLMVSELQVQLDDINSRESELLINSGERASQVIAHATSKVKANETIASTNNIIPEKKTPGTPPRRNPFVNIDKSPGIDFTSEKSFKFHEKIGNVRLEKVRDFTRMHQDFDLEMQVIAKSMGSSGACADKSLL